MKWSWAAAKTSAALSLLFLVLYGACNQFTATRSDVGTLFFEWERHIPFVPLMIIPYMSIDLFFVAAPFLCDDKQRAVLAKRIVIAIVVSCICFLLFPLEVGFERPRVDGFLGLIFNSFRLLDLPYNEFPSLHITLRSILACLYIPRARGGTRLALRVWFVLITVSTLFTYQHHVLDLVGGFALAVVCFYAVPDEDEKLPVNTNVRVGIYYAVGAVLLVGLALVFRPWGLLLLWPAVSLSIVAGAYFGLGPGIYRKRGGRLPLTTWCMLWPVLLGQRASLIYYARQCEAWDELTPRVWIGRLLSEHEASDAVARGVTAVLDLTGEFSEARPMRGVAYLQLPILDLTAPSAEHLSRAIAFIREHAADGVVYVHCKIGYSRSGAVAGAYLLASGECTNADDAIARLREVRPSIVIRPEAERCIRGYLAPRPDADHAIAASRPRTSGNPN